MDSGRHSYCPCLPGALWAEAPDFHSVYFSCQDPFILNDSVDVFWGRQALVSRGQRKCLFLSLLCVLIQVQF